MWDFFISHANEDKDEIARPLTKRLKDIGFKVWYDEFTLNVGDSLRESIDKGLSESRFGIVILSKAFFSKKWTKKELNGLFAREEEKVILPVWHGVNREDIQKYSLLLADKIATNTKNGLDNVIKDILKSVNPESEYLTNKLGTVEVHPSEINLGSKDWQVNTNFTIKNHSKRPLHGICVEISLIGNLLEFENINFEIIEKTKIARTRLNPNIEVDAEFYLLFAEDLEGNKLIFLYLFYLGPNEHKTFIISNKKAVGVDEPQIISLSVEDFQDTPIKLLKKNDGSIAVPFAPPKTCRAQGFCFKTSQSRRRR